MTITTEHALVVWLAIAALGGAAGLSAAGLLAYWSPKCPFCGAGMTRSRLRPERCYCHKCGGVKDGPHYWRGERRHE